LRAAEKFMVIGSGTAACKGCGYEYSPEKGDPDFPVARGTLFQVSFVGLPEQEPKYSRQMAACYGKHRVTIFSRHAVPKVSREIVVFKHDWCHRIGN
jgi:hypothetical protein